MKLNNELFAVNSYINGQWIDSPVLFDVINPATGDVVAQVCDGGAAAARDAVEAAYNALPAWKARTATQRCAILRKWFDLITKHQDDLAVIMTLEQGKPLAEAKGEIAYGAAFIEWFAEEGKRVYGDVISPPSADKRIVVIKQPVGVAAAVTPWNFPNAMITRKAAPALAAGCTFVVRPASQTPLSALALARLAQAAGIPDGVFNVVVGTDASGMGEVLTQSPKVSKFSFTGSTAVGRKLMIQSASTIKKVSLELGGNAPFIVFDDADMDEAVKGAIACKYRNAGQTCVCANRFFVQQSVHDEFVDRFAAAVGQLKVGNGMDQGTAIGPLINARAFEQVHGLVQASIDQGAQLVMGGKGHGLGGLFYQPTILTHVTHTMPVARQEIFGPVAPIILFNTEEELIHMANDTEYGLAAYFYARDIGRIWRIAEALDFGMVGVNEGIISNVAAPFGGVKASGIGREGSRYGLDEYLEIKYLCMGGIDK
ncbi:MAG: NAD-dependent succinate-semialdehyde dehydrogenase [Pseudomonadota bacterium]